MQYTNREGILMDVMFKCTMCESKTFQRNECYPANLTFLEGHFECTNCFEEYCYFDEAFTLVPSQLNLFDK
jgi:hypothetical protein